MTETMYLFPKLPTDIRLKIWHYGMHAPRVVRANWPYKTELSGPKNNPVQLSVNRESRHEALKQYEKLPGVGNIYVDFNQDTIFVDSCFIKVRIDHTIFESESRIQTLAVDYEYFVHRTKLLYQKVCRCTKLRKIILVMPDERMLVCGPEESEDPVVSAKFIHLNTKNYEHFSQVCNSVIADFKRAWTGADMPSLGVYLVKCSAGTSQDIAKLVSTTPEPFYTISST